MTHFAISNENESDVYLKAGILQSKMDFRFLRGVAWVSLGQFPRSLDVSVTSTDA